VSSDRCEACQKPLVWAVTKTGRTAPVELDPHPEGNVLVFRVESRIECRTAAGFALDWLREQGVPLRLNHFASCPQADRFSS
jgi:hypothetical protein